MLVTITGPSGVGKTTLYNNLRRERGFRPLVSTTSRAPRASDEEGFEYVSDEQFDALEKDGVFLWVVHPHGKKYGTRKIRIDEALTRDTISILVIEAVHTLTHYTKGNLVSFYIEIDDEIELRKRFAERGDMTSQEIESRIAECRSWNAQARNSGLPFIYLDGKKPREALLHDALAVIQAQ